MAKRREGWGGRRAPPTRTAVAVDLAALAHLDIAALREHWTELMGSPPAQRLSRDLMVRAIAHRVQEERDGGLSPKLLRVLRRHARATAGPSGES